MEGVEHLYVVAVVAVVVLNPYGCSVQVLHISLSSVQLCYHTIHSGSLRVRVK